VTGSDPASSRPVVNTHVHVPPNFSAFDDAEDVVATARREGVRVVGASNFHDQRVYRRFGDAARAAGLVPLFGMELITVLAPGLLARAGVPAGARINDPANPGRMYLCGKGIDPFRVPTPEASRIEAAARAANITRAARMTVLMRQRFEAAGVAVALDDAAIAAGVASRAGVPADWVVLQERHLAMAFQQALFAAVPVDERVARLAAVYDAAPTAAPDDAVAVQGEIRSRLMKAGCSAFVDESPLAFEDGVRLILAWDGIPAYPTLADGTSPVCPFEDGPEDLAERLGALGIHAAELIPGRNAPGVVDAYVRAFRAAGIVVTAGTEHNTLDRIPIEPLARGGAALSDEARAAFLEGTCVIAGHQSERAAGRPGFVDADGRPGPGDRAAWISRFAAIGAAVIEQGSSVP
jgi:hypothetical protein